MEWRTSTAFRLFLDEVFGPENRVATIAFAKAGASASKLLPQVADWLLWYAKNKENVRYRQLYEPLTRKEKLEHMSSYVMVELADGTCRAVTSDERRDPETSLPPGSRLFSRERLASQGESTTGRSEAYTWYGQVFPCPPGRHWTVDPQHGLSRLADKDRLVATGGGELRWKQYEAEIPGRKVHNLWPIPQAPTDMHYVVETAETVLERCLLMATDPGDLGLS